LAGVRAEGLLIEVVEQLNASGVTANQLQFKYLLPFHSARGHRNSQGCKRTICIEMNFDRPVCASSARGDGPQSQRPHLEV
jgi:hypothetical protein